MCIYTYIYIYFYLQAEPSRLQTRFCGSHRKSFCLDLYILQHTAKHCNTLQHTATHINTWSSPRKHLCIDFDTRTTFVTSLQHTETHWNTLQHTATHCNTLQHTAIHHSTQVTWRVSWTTYTNHILEQQSWLHSVTAFISCVFHGFWNTFLNRIPNPHFSTTFLNHSRFVSLHHTATHCNTLQNTATHCNTLQHTATHCNTQWHGVSHEPHTLQHTATHCNTLQRTATHCNTLQHTATHSDIARLMNHIPEPNSWTTFVTLFNDDI